MERLFCSFLFSDKQLVFFFFCFSLVCICVAGNFLAVVFFFFGQKASSNSFWCFSTVNFCKSRIKRSKKFINMLMEFAGPCRQTLLVICKWKKFPGYKCRGENNFGYCLQTIFKCSTSALCNLYFANHHNAAQS